ncbi:hypothetical protein ACJX0J_041604, partial [Zea mays]
MSRFLL